jgi:hypothetical protein
MIEESERQPCEIWSRVMGYHRPVSSFNIGKKSEWAERKFYKERNEQVFENFVDSPTVGIDS